MHLTGRISRPLAVLAAAGLVAGLAVTPAQAASKYDPKPTKIGAGWLAGELTAGLVHNEQFDFDDYGLSIDVALGLDAAGRKPKVARAVTAAVAKNVASYTTFQSATYLNVYAGPTAKAAVLALARDKNPRAFGGVDLIAQLESRVAGAAPIAGRIEDDYDPTDPFGGDFANVIGQSYAAQALSLAGNPKAGAAKRFLLQQQCAKGFFRQYFTSDKTRPDQSCQGAPAAERAPSTDATALAVLALLDVKGAKARRAVDNGVDWLVGHQRRDGSFSDNGKSSGIVNSNSTGVAGWALGAAGASRWAARAAAWIRGRQAPGPNPCSGQLAKETGAIAYDGTAYWRGQRNGITVKTSDQWRRVSAQALPALRWAPRAVGEFTVTATGHVQAGDVVHMRITGVAPGSRICVSGYGQHTELKGSRHSNAQLSFVAPHLNTPSRLIPYKVWLGSDYRKVVVRVTDSTA